MVERGVYPTTEMVERGVYPTTEMVERADLLNHREGRKGN